MDWKKPHELVWYLLAVQLAALGLVFILLWKLVLATVLVTASVAALIVGVHQV